MVEYIKETNEIVIRKNDYISLNSGFYKYIGAVKNISEVPTTDCLFVMDGMLFIRKLDLTRLNRIKITEEKAKPQDVSDELDLKVCPGDDSTLIIIKELLKGFTKDAFRKLFDNDSDMNNMRRAIEKSPNGKLSLDRFRLILDKLGLKYKIIVYSDDNNDYMVKEDLEKKLKKINADEVEYDVTEEMEEENE